MKKLIDISIIGYLLLSIVYWLKILPIEDNIIKTMHFCKESLFIGILLIYSAYYEINEHRKISLLTMGILSFVLTVFFAYDYNFKLLFINYFSGYASLVILISISTLYLLSKHRKIWQKRKQNHFKLKRFYLLPR